MELKIKDECDQCGTCISVCGADALHISDKLLWAKDRCICCLKCLNICPFGAIEQQ